MKNRFQKIEKGNCLFLKSTPVSSLDFLPTFCHLAQTPIPDDVELDGTVFLPALEGKSVPRRKPLVWAYYNAINEARVAMRDGKWKVLGQLDGASIPRLENDTTETLPLVQDAKLTDFEIYDMESDVHETTNLAKTRPELVERLGAKLERHYRELATGSHVWTPAE